jgi:steroid delta-isomerase-like uncharacterized protein
MGNSRNCRIIPDWIADYRNVGWAESAVLRDQAQDRSYAGRAAILDFLRALYDEGFSGSRRNINRIVVDGSGAVVEYTLHGRHSGPFAGIRPTGREVALPMVFVCDIHDGRILRANLYYDTGILLRQLGLA